MKQNVRRIDSLRIHELLHDLALLEGLLVNGCSAMLTGGKMWSDDGAVSIGKRGGTCLLLLTEAEVLFDLSGILNELDTPC